MYPYKLLHDYKKQATIQSNAYKYSEGFYRSLHKWLTYPIILLSAVSTILSGFNINHYSIMSISFSTLVLVGFERAINPKDKEQKSCQIKIEMNEIASNIKQFILNNHRTEEEIKQYTQLIHEQINIWNSIAPPIQDMYITKSTNKYAERTRKHKQEYNTHSGSSLC